VSRSTDIQIGFQFVGGILLLRAGNVPPAERIAIHRNDITAVGARSVINVAAIGIFGGVADLRMANNTVGCDGCAGIQYGMWLRYGTMSRLRVHDNAIAGTGIALFLGFEAPVAGLNISDAQIVDNAFVSSTNAFAAQVLVSADAGETVDAFIGRNRIHDGAGYGILCTGTGTKALTGLLTNDFANNLAGDVSGCS
jgi:hypothetical protein